MARAIVAGMGRAHHIAMNADLANTDLSLPQAFLLLATNDKDGKPEVPVFALRATVAGAVLAELDLLGAIGLQGKHVKATGTAPQTDLQRELDLIRGKSRPHTPQWWVSALEGRPEVLRIYEGMVALGILEHAGEKRLGRFRAVRYPEKDHAPEEALLKKIHAVLSNAPDDAKVPETTVPETTVPETTVPEGAGPEGTVPETTAPGGTETPVQDSGTPDTVKPAERMPNARILALIALLQAAGLFSKLFPDADRIWADELAKDYWPARAVEDELRLIRIAEEEAATL